MLCSYSPANQSLSVTTHNPPLGQPSAPDSSFRGPWGDFIDQAFARELQIPCVKSPIHRQIQALDGLRSGGMSDQALSTAGWGESLRLLVFF